MRKKSDAIGWFLFGIGSQLQILASLSFTEAFVLLAGPILLLRGEYAQMRKSGAHVFFVISLLVLVGCIINYFHFGAWGYFALRRFAQVSIFVCMVPVAHWMIRRDMSSVKWLVLGNAISGILCVFVFQKSVEVVMYGSDAKDISEGTIFWIQRIGPCVTAPIVGWYLRIPLVYSVMAPILFSVFCVVSSASGRSAALVSIAFAVLVFIGGKSVRRMKKIRKSFWALLILGVIMIPIVTKTYGWLASSGKLGELQRKKYESQGKGRGDIVTLLIGGRAESLVGIYACCYSPIFGFGLDGHDPKGYWGEFMSKYGTDDDWETYRLTAERLAKMGMLIEDGGIPTHSHIGAFWTYYGVFGLAYWLYFIYVMLRYIKEDAYVIPQWYAWLACAIPGFFWGIFFSPVSNRVGMPLVLVACLYVRAIRLGKCQMPAQIALEIEHYAK